MFQRIRLQHVVGLVAIVATALPGVVADDPTPVDTPSSLQQVGIHETGSDAPAKPTEHTVHPPRVSTMRTDSLYPLAQVNVNAQGNNIVGDAANEPSIGVNPNDPNQIVIAWRQFDSTASDWREAGVAYSHNTGQTWTAYTLENGTFRTDPVVDTNPNGTFYFYSLKKTTAYPKDILTCDMFMSTNGGITWSAPIFAYGGDKQWFTIDKTGGTSQGNVYAAWSTATGTYEVPYANPPFTRSTDDGYTYEWPIAGYTQPTVWGTLTVAPDGTLYIGGVRSPASFVNSTFDVIKSVDAKYGDQDPTFSRTTVSMGGACLAMGIPNPSGLLGQTWIASDHSDSPTNGNLYLLCSVQTESDPLDVHFVRSTNGGATWSSPITLNDDPEGSGAYQWFGTLSVAPNGRLDAAWADTRADLVTDDPTQSDIRYCYSQDGGATWSENQIVTPPWHHYVGYPQQSKIGDYYDMVSTDDAAHLAFAATFNDEQDVYYVRLGDCNGNGIHDGDDIALGNSDDCTGNGIPDECEPDCNSNGVADSCDIAESYSEDCTGNGIPDECEDDCNGNGIADSCDLASGFSADCNLNGIPDECDVTAGTSPDTNGDGIPDECAVCAAFERAKLVAPSGVSSDEFGYVVAISGDALIAGAPQINSGAGRAFIARRTGKVWGTPVALTASDGQTGDQFGRAVAIDGDVAVIGAWGVDDAAGSYGGAVYIFRYSGTIWSEEAKLVRPADCPTHFGYSVAVSGDTVVVGALMGAAYVFNFDGLGWVKHQRLTPSGGTANFGAAVAVDGDVALVGAYGTNGNTGAAVVFRRSGKAWSQEAFLTAADGESYDQFGYSVALSGNVAVIGARYDDEERSNCGSAYAFRHADSAWTEEHKFLLPVTGSNDRTGNAVGVDGDTAIIGGVGRYESADAYTYHYENGAWYAAAVLRASDGAEGDGFGFGVAISGDTAVVGAHLLAPTGYKVGAAYVYRGLADCDDSGTVDVCDILAEALSDFNDNGVADQCEGLGDMNCDGATDSFDIDYFIQAVISEQAWIDYYSSHHGGTPPPCPYERGDVNGDGAVNTGDVNPFVALLTF